MCQESQTTLSQQKRPRGRPRRAIRTRMTCYLSEAAEAVLRAYSKRSGIPLTDVIEAAVAAYVPLMEKAMYD